VRDVAKLILLHDQAVATRAVLAHVVVFVQGNHRRQLFPVDAHLGGQHRLGRKSEHQPNSSAIRGAVPGARPGAAVAVVAVAALSGV